jgi:RNA polymerase sigma-70 factor, ECF subfamily
MSVATSIVEDNYCTEAVPPVAQLVPVMSRASVSSRPNGTRKTAQAEEDLVERLRSGDEKALEELFDRFAPRLYNVAQRILGEVADAEEVIQDVFWTAFRKAGTFRGSARFSTWLYRLTINAALGKLRRRKGNKDTEYEEYLPKFQSDGHHRVRPVVDWSDTLDERYAKQEVQQLLKDALAQLRPVDKSVVVLSDIEEISDKEIAEMLGLTVAAVKTRLHRARLFLRGTLAVRLGHSPA